MASSYSARSRRKGIYKPIKTLFKVPCGTNVREREKKERLESFVAITIILKIPY